MTDLDQFGAENNPLDPFCVDRKPHLQNVPEAWIEKGTDIYFPLKSLYDAKFYTVVPPAISDSTFDVTEKTSEGAINDEDIVQKPVQPINSVEGGILRQMATFRATKTLCRRPMVAEMPGNIEVQRVLLISGPRCGRNIVRRRRIRQFWNGLINARRRTRTGGAIHYNPQPPP